MPEDLLDNEKDRGFFLNWFEGMAEELHEQTVGPMDQFTENATAHLSRLRFVLFADDIVILGGQYRQLLPRVFFGTIGEALQNEIPSELGTRVVTVSGAAKGTLNFLESALFTVLNIDDDGLAALFGESAVRTTYTMVKRSKLIAAILGATNEVEILAALRNSIRSNFFIALIFLLLVGTVASALVILMPLSVIYWSHFEGLPQDSKRVGGTRRGQRRINQRKGPDL